MFDLKSNFVIKSGGQEDFHKTSHKTDRSFFLCLSKEAFLTICKQFPKSNTRVQKRALERRQVFMLTLSKLEKIKGIKR
jgi:hypothetical protein